MADLEKIIKVTQAQYDILASGGKVGDYVGLQDSYIYMIEDTNEYITKSLTSTKGDMIYASAANTPARLGIGSTGQFLSIADGVPKWVDRKISGTVTKEIGGISKDKVYTDADIIDVLSDLLFPYVAPAISSITLSDAAGTYEYGTAKTVSQVTLNFAKGSKNIISIKIGTSSGGNDLYSGDSATSGTAIPLTKSKTYDGKTIGSNNIYCTISDGTQSASTSATIKYIYYTYSKLTTSTSPDTSGATRRNQSDADSTYSYTAGQYLWLYSRDANKKIQTYVAGSWAGVNTTASSEITLTLSSGATAKYYAYRTDKFTATGQARYRLA